MDYQKHYDALVIRAQTRVLQGYSEKHHIVPKCLGGSNAKSNIVALTAEEHYVAHQLLVKLHPDNAKLLYACSMMSGNNGRHKHNNKLFGWLRKRQSELNSAAMSGEGNPFFGKKHTEESRAKIRAARAKQQVVPGQYERLAEKHRGVPKPKRTAEQKALISERTKAAVKPLTDEQKARKVANYKATCAARKARQEMNNG